MSDLNEETDWRAVRRDEQHEIGPWLRRTGGEESAAWF